MLSKESVVKACRYNLKQFRTGKFHRLPDMFAMWLPDNSADATKDNMGAFTWATLMFQIPQLDLANDGMCGPNTLARISLYFNLDFPLSGKGFWVWRDHHIVPEMAFGGDGLESALRAKAKEYYDGGIKFILLKVADDCYLKNIEHLDTLYDVFREYNIKIVPWVYVWNYSKSDLRNTGIMGPKDGLHRPGEYDDVTTWQDAIDRQAQIHTDIADALSSTFLIINAERGFKALRARKNVDLERQWVTNYQEQARHYLRSLKIKGLTTALSTYGLPQNQTRHLPLKEMMEYVKWGMPQWYWDVKGRTPREMITDGEKEWRQYTDKPLIPSGGCWQPRDHDGDWLQHWHTAGEVVKFMDILKARNCPWVAFWREVGVKENRTRFPDDVRKAIYDYEW